MYILSSMRKSCGRLELLQETKGLQADKDGEVWYDQCLLAGLSVGLRGSSYVHAMFLI